MTTPTIPTEDIVASLLRQTTAHTVGTVSERPVTMMLVKEGIMKVQRNRIGTFYRLAKKFSEMKASDAATFVKAAGDQAAAVTDALARVGEKDEIAELPSASTFPYFTLTIPRIPVALLHQTIEFFRKVYDKQQTEAAVLIRYNPTRGHYVEVPEQDLSGGGVKYKADPTNTDPIVIDIHSHHTMAPFFSGVDDRDEQSTQFYGVVGHIEISHPAVNIRARMDGSDICFLRPEILFDMEVSPIEWMEKIKEPPKVLITGRGYSWEGDADRNGNGHGKKIESGESASETPSETGFPEQRPHSYPSSSISEGGLFDDPILAEGVEAVLALVEREIYDYPEAFSTQFALDLVKQMIVEKIEGMDPVKISTR